MNDNSAESGTTSTFSYSKSADIVAERIAWVSATLMAITGTALVLA